MPLSSEEEVKRGSWGADRCERRVGDTPSGSRSMLSRKRARGSDCWSTSARADGFGGEQDGGGGTVMLPDSAVMATADDHLELRERIAMFGSSRSRLAERDLLASSIVSTPGFSRTECWKSCCKSVTRRSLRLVVSRPDTSSSRRWCPGSDALGRTPRLAYAID